MIYNGITTWRYDRDTRLRLAALGAGDAPHRVGMIPGQVLGHHHTYHLKPSSFYGDHKSLSDRLKSEHLLRSQTAMLMVDVEHHNGLHLSDAIPFHIEPEDVFTVFRNTCSTTEPICGNGICEAGENNANCPGDCPPPVCGNGICELGEDSVICPVESGGSGARS